MPIVSGEILILLSFLIFLIASILRVPPLLAVAIGLLSYFLTELIVYQIKLRSLFHGGITMERAISGISGPSVIFTGKRLRIGISVRNSAPFTYHYLQLQDCVPQNWEVMGENQAIFELPAKDEAQFSYMAIAKSSGNQVLPGLYATLFDESHLFSRAFFYPLRSAFSVYISPEDINLRILSLPKRGEGWAIGPHVLRQKGIGSEFREIRDYVPGDSFKKIAWGISARKNRLMSKEVDSEVSIRSTIFLDISPSMREGIIHQTKLDCAVRTAANFAKLSLENRDPVGIYTFDSQIRSHVAPRATRTQLYTILAILSKIGDFELSMTEDVFNFYLSLFYQHLDRISPYLPGAGVLPRGGRSFSGQYLGEYFGLSEKEVVQLKEDNYFRSKATEYMKEMDMIAPSPSQLFCSHCQSTSPFYVPTCPKCGSEFEDMGYDKTQALTRALCQAMSKSKGKEILIIISDLERILDEERFLRLISLVRFRHHRLVILCPSTLAFRRRRYGLKAYTEEFLEQATQLQRKVEELKVPIHSLGPEDSVDLLLSKIVELKAREGVR